MVKLRFLGTGNAFVPGGRAWCGAILDDRILLDCSPSTLLMLNRAEIDPGQIDALFLSHQHSDHTYGLPFLLLVYKWIQPREQPLEIVFHDLDFLERLVDLGYPEMWESIQDQIEVIDAASGTAAGVEFRRYPVRHDPKLSLSVCFSLELDSVRIGYSGDTGVCDGLEQMLRVVDTAIVELAIPDGVPFDGHLSPRDLLALARKHPDVRFIPTHLYFGPGKASQMDALAEVRELANVTFPEDGDVFDL